MRLVPEQKADCRQEAVRFPAAAYTKGFDAVVEGESLIMYCGVHQSPTTGLAMPRA